MRSAFFRSFVLRTPYRHRLPFTFKPNFNRLLSSNRRLEQSESPNPEEKRNAQGPVTWRSLSVILALGTAGLAYYTYEHERRLKGW